MKSGLVTVVLVLGLTTSLIGQDQVEVREITLNEAVDIALENNYQLKQAENNLDLAGTEVLSAKADFLPSVNGSFEGSSRGGQQFNNTTVRFEDVVTNSLSGSVGASITIFDGFRNIQNLRRSRANAGFQSERLQRTKETVIFQTVSGYLQVILNKELLRIAEENLDASKTQLEQVRAQVEVGSRPSVDLYNQESVVASNELEVIRRENALSFSKTQLIGTLQLEPLGEYKFVTPELGNIAPQEENLQLSRLIEQAISNRDDLRAQELLIERNQEDLGMAKSGLYPTVTASASISGNYNDQFRERVVDPNDPNNIIARKVDFSNQFFDLLVNKFAGFSVRIPIFNNFNTGLNVQRAKINLKNSKLELENLKFTIYEEVRQAYNDYISFAKQLESTEKALRAAERAYETEQERYNVGASTLIELDNANANFVQAQSDRARALFNFIFQHKLLDYYLGKLDEDISLNYGTNE